MLLLCRVFFKKFADILINNLIIKTYQNIKKYCMQNEICMSILIKLAM